MIAFQSQVDSVDTDDNNIAVSLSNLEGNTWDGFIKILSLESGQEIASIRSPVGISQVRYCGLENNIISLCRDDGQISLLRNDDSLNSDVVKFSNTFQAHNDIASALGVSSTNTNQLLSCGWDSCIKVWDINALSFDNSDEIQPTLSIFHAHCGCINDLTCCPTNPNLFASVGSDGFARTWDTRQTNSFCQSFDVRDAGSAILWDSYDSNFIITGTDSGYLYRFDCRRVEPTDSKDSVYSKIEAHKGRIRRIINHPKHHNCILTASDDTTIGSFELCVGSYENNNNILYKELHRIHEHTDYVTDIVVPKSIACDLLISASSDKSIRQTNLF